MVGESGVCRRQSDDRSQHSKFIPHFNTSPRIDPMKSLVPLTVKLAYRISRLFTRLPCQHNPLWATTKCSREKLHETQSTSEDQRGQDGRAALTPPCDSASLRS